MKRIGEENGFRVALLTYGDREAQKSATLETSRFGPTAASMRAVGLEPRLVIYNDDFAGEVREQLLQVDAAQVWVNPIEQGRDRTILDALLREVASAGVLVSAHPDIILKMGTKVVLFETRDMSWGCDTHLYRSAADLREQLPIRLEAGEARVLKQYRGNGGNGVWKVERHPDDPLRVRARHALRGSPEQEMPLEDFLAQCGAYFANGGRIIDQAYQDRLTDGMVRCYLVQDQVAGFGHQEINLLFPAPDGEIPPLPTTRLYYPPTDPRFHAIKAKMENEWLTALCQKLDIDPRTLPLIWDADFLFGPKTASGEDTYVLGEINVSAVYPFPDSALEPLAAATKAAITMRSAI